MNNTRRNLVFLLVLIFVIVGASYGLLTLNKGNKSGSSGSSLEVIPGIKKSDYTLTGNSLENFDLYFLKLENQKANKIYSPLSIKYALEMLAEGASGSTKEQLTNIIGSYEAKKYTNSENMSLANAMFIRDSIKDSIKQDYINKIQNRYSAEVVYDSFESASNINNWVKNKTLNLLDNLVDDDTVRSLDFALINALAIDMEWQEKFFENHRAERYFHEKLQGDEYTYGWYSPQKVNSGNFDGVENEVSGMQIIASLNNYDIISELGEETIRKTVGDAYREYLSDPKNEWERNETLKGDFSETNIENAVNKYLDSYIDSIKQNYKKNSNTTNFELYVDDNVKVFGKDLKEYDGTTLQYVGIMPIKDSLDSYISSLNAEKINSILGGLKELKLENFKDGYVTVINGYIPKFKFDYALDLYNDLKKLGVTDVFDPTKADLSNLNTQKGSYISSVSHKANIEFTQDGIKASAATIVGGLGAAGAFDYLFEVPTERIDLTFDKPYMFIIRDKNTGEVWFTGTVYNPLSWNEDQTK